MGLLLVLIAGCGSSAGPSTGTLPELRGITELRTAFNESAGSVRVVLILSPTCPTCVVGASWVKLHILDRYPTARLRIFAVWVPQFPGDKRSKWNADALSDPRVVQFWNQDSSAGRWFRDHVQLTYESGPVLWDAYLLYGPKAQWTDVPHGLVSSGRPVIGSTSQLAKDVAQLLSVSRRRT